MSRLSKTWVNAGVSPVPSAPGDQRHACGISSPIVGLGVGGGGYRDGQLADRAWSCVEGVGVIGPPLPSLTDPLAMRFRGPALRLSKAWVIAVAIRRRRGRR